MVRKIVWFVVSIAILVVVYVAYEYNTQLEGILSSIDFGDISSLTNKAKEIVEQASSGNVLSWDVMMSWAEAVITDTVNTISGAVAEIASGTEAVISGAIN